MNCDKKTQLNEIKVSGKWKEGFGYDEKGELRKLNLTCKWFRKTQNDIVQIKNISNSYQMSLHDVGTTIQLQSIP